MQNTVAHWVSVLEGPQMIEVDRATADLQLDSLLICEENYNKYFPCSNSFFFSIMIIFVAEGKKHTNVSSWINEWSWNNYSLNTQKSPQCKHSLFYTISFWYKAYISEWLIACLWQSSICCAFDGLNLSPRILRWLTLIHVQTAKFIKRFEIQGYTVSVC